MKIVYQADDGAQFSTETECNKHETDTALYYHIRDNAKICGATFVKDVETYICENIVKINSMLGVKGL